MNTRKVVYIIDNSGDVREYSSSVICTEHELLCRAFSEDIMRDVPVLGFHDAQCRYGSLIVNTPGGIRLGTCWIKCSDEAKAAQHVGTK